MRKRFLFGLLTACMVGGYATAQTIDEVVNLEESIDDTKIAQYSTLVDSLAADTVVSDVPKDRVDTIYYDPNWKAISNKAFAAYYRYALYPADSMATKLFRTFYMNGVVEGEGNFSTLDKYDDNNSKFVGKCTRYYKSGKVKEVSNYFMGLLDGEYTSYYENGLVNEHIYMSDNRRNGIYSKFSDDGETCKQIEYINGTESEDYVNIDRNNNFGRFRCLDNKPINIEPKEGELKSEHKNGVKWLYYLQNGLVIGVTKTISDEIGSNRRFDFFILNKSMSNIDIDPDNIEAYSVKGDKRRLSFFVPYDKYMDEKGKRERKKAIAIQSGKVIIDQSPVDITIMNLGGDIARVNTVQEFQEEMLKRSELADCTPVYNEDNKITNIEYIRRTTIHPGEGVYGFLLTDSKKTEHFFIEMKINGITYKYKWDVLDEKK
ncbi:MAG: hypothetical protein LUD00_12330 [Prevotellaceae bacterium]|nr:hypothetical protein [Prevotellaceae bacterium]